MARAFFRQSCSVITKNQLFFDTENCLEHAKAAISCFSHLFVNCNLKEEKEAESNNG